MTVQALIKQLQKLPLQSEVIIEVGSMYWKPITKVEEVYYEEIQPGRGEIWSIKDNKQENYIKAVELRVNSLI